jgi:predicted nuclease with RNAse H fold
MQIVSHLKQKSMENQESNLIYLGIDVAGASNTWVSGLSQKNGHLEIVLESHSTSLEKIVNFCKENHVVSAAIDAQLTMSLQARKGFRQSDKKLRELLPANCRNWVASVNSLMAVPVRGRFLSDFLAPIVGTIIETHPRASLLFGLGKVADTAVRKYKKSDDDKHLNILWENWSQRFNILSHSSINDDGALDAIVCATVAYLYHHKPETLRRLRENNSDIRGRGPFYVLAPAFKQNGG